MTDCFAFNVTNPSYADHIVCTWNQYIFGSEIIGVFVLMIFLLIWGIRHNWSFDVYVAIFVPLFFVMALPSAGIGLTSAFGLALIALGFIIGLGLLALMRKR